jgi:hypothetical protein
VVAERKLLTEALKFGLGEVEIQAVERELAKRPLIRAEQLGRKMAATANGLAEEARLLAFAREGRGRFRPLGDAERPCRRDWLNDGQKAAVKHVLASRDAVTLIRGVFGTGKTTLEQEIKEALSESGLPVVALAPTAAATDVLKNEAGIASADTVARFLVDKNLQSAARWGVVLVDEAGMVGTRDMLRLFDAAKQVQARIVLVGDRRQTRSVSAGEPLRLLEERAGLPVAEVTEILRQTGEYKQAAKALSEGRTADALKILDGLGWIREVPGGERYAGMAHAYLLAIEEQKRGGQYKTALAVSPTWAEANRITAAIRQALKAKGKLGDEQLLDTWMPAHLTGPQKRDAANLEQGDLLVFHQPAPGFRNGSRLLVEEGKKLPLQFAERFEVYRPAQVSLAVGDRLRVTRNGVTRDGGHALRNGNLFTVQGFTPKGDVIIDHGWVIPKEWGHIAMGYAVSAESSQGRTVDKVLIGLSTESFPAANQRRFNVPVTRGREQALIFTDDKQGLRQAVERPDEPMSAMELAELQRPKPKLRQRLKKHLGYLRRLEFFGRKTTDRGAERDKMHTLQKEHGYAR